MNNGIMQSARAGKPIPHRGDARWRAINQWGGKSDGQAGRPPTVEGVNSNRHLLYRKTQPLFLDRASYSTFYDLTWE
jgi:hypothetical protein